MADTASLDALKTALEGFSDATTTLYIPRPLIQVGGEKWRIQKKNILDDLAEVAPDATETARFVDALELDEFNGLGIVVFEDGDSFQTAHMNTRPTAMMQPSGEPFVLPLLRDLGSRRTAWLLALDKEEPQLFLYSGGEVSDHSARLRTPDGNDDEPVTMETIQARREVQNDVFFHAGSRGKVRTSDARSNYHALGTGVDAEEEKTLGAYYQLVIDALKYGLPYQVGELYVMGTEKVVGRFCQLAEGDLGEDFQLHQIHDGEATEERIKEHLSHRLDTLPEKPQVALVTDTDRIFEACRVGRVGEVYIADDLTDGLDTTTDSDSERVKTLIIGVGYGEPLADALPHDALARAALAQGAQFQFVPESFTGHPVAAVMRWEVEGDPAGVSPEEDVEMMDEAARRQAAE